jgi:hypothetical protein
MVEIRISFEKKNGSIDGLLSVGDSVPYGEYINPNSIDVFVDTLRILFPSETYRRFIKEKVAEELSHE